MQDTLERYSIVVEPRDDVYERLLRFLARHCDEIWLVLRDANPVSPAAGWVLEALEPALLIRRDSQEWPGTALMGSFARVHQYRLDDAARTILASSVRGLYDWVSPARPEDPSAMRRGKPMLTTIAHERDSYLDLTRGEAEELGDLNPGLKLFCGNLVPRSAEPYRLFGAFLDDDSLRLHGSVGAALGEYVAMTSADRLQEVGETIRHVLASRTEDILLEAILQRWGTPERLTTTARPSSLLREIADKLTELTKATAQAN
jgi:hypothetical protein